MNHRRENFIIVSKVVSDLFSSFGPCIYFKGNNCFWKHTWMKVHLKKTVAMMKPVLDIQDLGWDLTHYLCYQQLKKYDQGIEMAYRQKNNNHWVYIERSYKLKKTKCK